MKKLNFTTVGIGILIVLNIIIVGTLFMGRYRHRSFEKMHTKDQSHAKNNSEFKNDRMHEKKIHHNRHGHFAHFPMKGLNLSEDQKAKVDKLNIGFRKEKEAFENRIDNLQSTERDLRKENKLDSAHMNILADKYGEYQRELKLLKMQHIDSFRKILTKDQIVQLDKRRMEWKEKGMRNENHPYQN